MDKFYIRTYENDTINVATGHDIAEINDRYFEGTTLYDFKTGVLNGKQSRLEIKRGDVFVGYIRSLPMDDYLLEERDPQNGFLIRSVPGSIHLNSRPTFCSETECFGGWLNKRVATIRSEKDGRIVGETYVDEDGKWRVGWYVSEAVIEGEVGQ